MNKLTYNEARNPFPSSVNISAYEVYSECAFYVHLVESIALELSHIYILYRPHCSDLGIAALLCGKAKFHAGRTPGVVWLGNEQPLWVWPFSSMAETSSFGNSQG